MGTDAGLVRLAIVDDHELIRDGLCALLEREHQERVVVVYSGDSVADAAASAADVTLLDIELGPGSEGVAANTATLHDSGSAVLVFSAHDEPVQIRDAMRAGALGFVSKRVSYSQLIEALDTVSRDELYLSVDLASMLASAADTPDLSARELDALRLYASGLKLSAVARRMAISPHTAKEYLDRVRQKYQQVGRPARTRTELYVAAARDGLLPDAPG